jgi:hypothetical protein
MAKKKKKKKKDPRDYNLAFRSSRDRANRATVPREKKKQGWDTGGPLIHEPGTIDPECPSGDCGPEIGGPDKPYVSKKSSRKRKGSGYTTFLGETPGMGPLSPAGTPPRDRRGRGRRGLGLGFGPGQGGGGTPGAGGQGK